MTRLNRREFLKITALAGGGVAGSWLLGKHFNQQLYTLKETRTLMGTLIHLTVVSDDEEHGRSALNTTFAEMERLVSLFNYRQPGSPLDRLNREGVLHNAPAELTAVMSTASAFSELTAGAFDVTVKPVLDAYGNGRLPTTAEQSLVNYKNIQFSGDKIAFTTPNMAVTLDGIAKGYVVDGGVAALRAQGFENVLVEAGGDLVVNGHPTNEQGWRLGIAHPRPDVMEGYLATFSMNNGAVATSGDYMHYFSEDRLSHHIIDPRTGKSPLDLASVTVIAPDATTADTLSTAVMVMGAKQGLLLANQLPDVEALIITKELTVRRTSGFPTHL